MEVTYLQGLGGMSVSPLKEVNVGLIQGKNQLIIEVKNSFNPLRTFTIYVKTFHEKRTPFVQGYGGFEWSFFQGCNCK
jgi:hypothetical protein